MSLVDSSPINSDLRVHSSELDDCSRETIQYADLQKPETKLTAGKCILAVLLIAVLIMTGTIVLAIAACVGYKIAEAIDNRKKNNPVEIEANEIALRVVNDLVVADSI